MVDVEVALGLVDVTVSLRFLLKLARNCRDRAITTKHVPHLQDLGGKLEEPWPIQLKV